MSDTSELHTIPNAVHNIESTSTILSSTPIKQQVAIKRPHNVNSLQFNSSNRKSNSLGTFYYKHHDTDGGGDCSSQDATSEVYSDDDQWEYKNGDERGKNAAEEDEEINANISQTLNLTHLSMKVNCNESISIDAVDSPIIKQVCF